ncbi:hypothetical protein CAEBREN_12427 [Caenorhabditis brenneri]|uniref:Uncharacterized protein n=1 Tax=Caenorhabditis brenneri TaxID=135651 RepID=G0P144_CAEBE|nr:hypothetical protein CAEBREN_12427 [Caenorhabditis brenneri]
MPFCLIITNFILTFHSIISRNKLKRKFYHFGSSPDLKDEFNCRYKKIDEIIGLEFEGMSSLDFKTVGMDNHLLLPINLFSQEDRFQKLNGKFDVINSNGISDYVVIGDDVRDQNTESMPTSELLRKYKGDYAAREMIGSCSLNRMKVPKMMVDVTKKLSPLLGRGSWRESWHIGRNGPATRIRGIQRRDR